MRRAAAAKGVVIDAYTGSHLHRFARRASDPSATPQTNEAAYQLCGSDLGDSAVRTAVRRAISGVAVYKRAPESNRRSDNRKLMDKETLAGLVEVIMRKQL